MDLETPHLILTPMQPHHLAELEILHNDPLVRAAIFHGIRQSRSDVAAKLALFLQQWPQQGFGFWMVYEKTDAGLSCIGRAGLRAYDDTGHLEFGYVFSSAGAGRGLGPEAARASINHALTIADTATIVGLIAPGNRRALAAATKLGFRYVEDRWRDGQRWHYLELTRTGFLQAADA